MNPYAMLAAVGASILCAVIAAGSGYHFGAMASRTALERDHAAMAEAATAALLAQRSQQEAETARLNKVVSDYENTPIDPIVPGIARRVFIYASRPDCPVPETHPLAGRVETPAALPGSAGRVEQALAAYIDACAADSAQLNAVIQLAP